jgi:asparagine synthetase B (glutamine-hydrolysing)
MSDFLVQMGNGCSSEHLLALLKLPYGRLAPKGRGFAFPWGSIAVLEDPLGSNQNITASDQGVLAWVGDLVGGMSDSFRTALTARLAALQHSARDCDNDLQNDPVFKQLNGAFAILFADQTGYSIVVDPLGATQVFFGKGHDGQRVSAGTHADLVATAAGISDEMDFVSITQFLRHGYCVFPCTMYKNLVEGQPGAVHAMCRTEDEDLRPRQWSYWSPPPEVRTGYREADLAETLCEVFLASVADRCGPRRTGVALSGGLDSRLVTAAVPGSKPCTAFTLCDRLNREAKTAQRAAAAYGRPWFPLFRQKEYLADHLVDVVKFVGCE